MQHMSLQQRSNPMMALALLLCLSPLFLVEIRAVPASVLAQNSELSTSASNKLHLQQEHQQQQQLQEQQQQQQPAAGEWAKFRWRRGWSELDSHSAHTRRS